MSENTSTLTERGQVSLPAAIRKEMGLHTGQKLHWECISEREGRFVVEETEPAGPMATLGYARRLRGGAGRRTAEWMRELRSGERR